MKKVIYIILALVILISCSEFRDEKDFRNYLRDKHPYSELIEIDLGLWSYQVNDTINGDIWIYNGSKNKYAVRKHLVIN